MLTKSGDKRNERWVLRRALIQYCAANGLTRAALARRLEAPYPTVASWWTVRSGSARKTNTFSERWAQRVLEKFPELVSGFFDKTKTGPQQCVEVRRRELPADVKTSICSVASRAVTQLALVESLLSESRRDFAPKQSPALTAKEFRSTLGIGLSAPVHVVKNALEQLGVPVVRLPCVNVGDRWVTTLVSAPRPIIVIVGGASADPERERFAIVAELGFSVVSQSLRAAPKRHAVNEFADEFLAPEAGIRRWIVSGQKTYSESDLASVASAFSVPQDSIERQFRRLGLCRDTPWGKSGGEITNFGYLAFLAKRLQVEPGAFH